MEHETVRGVSVPAVGLGTAGLSASTAATTVERALELGYRHVDTARTYDNERGVGDGLAAAAVDREDVFLTTKLGAECRREGDVLGAVRDSLSRLRTDYLDLLLVHFPVEDVHLEETLAAMADAVDRGLVRHVGVSNFGVERLHRARELADVPVVVDQVAYHPYRSASRLRDYCRINDVLLTAYSPLGKGRVVDDPVLEDVGSRYGKSAAQVALRWLVQQDGVVTIPGSSTPAHLAANRDVFDFELTDAEMRRVHRPGQRPSVRRLLRERLPI